MFVYCYTNKILYATAYDNHINGGPFIRRDELIHFLIAVSIIIRVVSVIKKERLV